MFRGQGEVRGIFKKTDKQNNTTNIDKIGKIRGNFSLFLLLSKL